MSKESERTSLSRCSCGKRELWKCCRENGLNSGKMCLKDIKNYEEDNKCGTAKENG